MIMKRPMITSGTKVPDSEKQLSAASCTNSIISVREITASIKRRVNYVCESKVTLIQQKAEEMFMAFEKLQKQSESVAH